MPFVLIVGGGLAGSTAGILLRRMGWEVSILEKSKGPKEKVCGEFLSPGVWPLLNSLDLSRSVLTAGGCVIREAQFLLSSKNPVRTRLLDKNSEMPAYGISRRLLDDLFLRKAEEEGCLVMRGFEVKNYRDDKEGFEVQALSADGSPASLQTRWIIEASGSRKLPTPPASQTGFKTHFQASMPEEILRLIFFRGGYFGFSGIEEGLTNLCGIVENRVLKKAGGDFNLLLRNAADRNKTFGAWLSGAEQARDWLACPIHYGFQKNFRPRVFYLGDSFCFVEPLLGQGMTLAMASGFVLASFLREKRISQQEAPSPQLAAEFRRRLEKLYSWKFRLGHALKFLTPGLYGRLVNGLDSRLLWQPLADLACTTPAAELLEIS